MPITAVVSIVGAVISLVSAAAAIGRWTVTYHQIRTQNLLQIFNYLHQNELREARHRVRTATPSTLDEEALRKVCSSFDFAGLFISHGLMKKDIFLEYWNELFFHFRTLLAEIRDRPCFGDVSWRRYYPNFFEMIDASTKPDR